MYKPNLRNWTLGLKTAFSRSSCGSALFKRDAWCSLSAAVLSNSPQISSAAALSLCLIRCLSRGSFDMLLNTITEALILEKKSSFRGYSAGKNGGETCSKSFKQSLTANVCC